MFLFQLLYNIKTDIKILRWYGHWNHVLNNGHLFVMQSHLIQTIDFQDFWCHHLHACRFLAKFFSLWKICDMLFWHDLPEHVLITLEFLTSKFCMLGDYLEWNHFLSKTKFAKLPSIKILMFLGFSPF